MATHKAPYSKHKARKTKVPESNTSVLTCTSKMPGPSFSLPAGRACVNAHGEVCDNCYAKGGCYQYANVAAAQELRFQWTIECMRTEAGRALWAETMILAIETTGVKYFRGHDSGDFFNVAYVESWIAVAAALPHVRFWFPTREYQVKPSLNPFVVLGENPRLAVIRRLAALPNVTVRPSALSIGHDAPVVDGLASGSAVASDNAYQCPAYKQEGFCGDCRHCWDNPTVAVSYPLH